MTGIFLFLGRLLVLVGLTALLSEAAARIGAGVLPLIYRRSTSRLATGVALERFGLGLLLGWAALGIAYLGLALAGLFTPLALAGCALALLCGSRAMWEPRLLLATAAAEGRSLGGGLAVLVLGLAPAVLFMLLPEGEHDVWVYHLGVPWQYLQAGRAVLEHVQMRYHYPLTFEMAFALPLIAGDDRLAKGMVISCFVAASAVFAARCLKAGRPVLAWLGPLLVLSSTSDQMQVLIMMCKSDVPAASLFVTGAMLQLAGAWAPGAFLLGLCVASKLVYGPVVAVWSLFFLPSLKKSPTGGLYLDTINWKRLIWWAALLVLPLMPWMVKSWLATGNPVYPFATGIFPSLEWAEPNREAFELYRVTNLPGGVSPRGHLPAAWFTYLKENHLLLLLFLPGLLLLSRHRRAAWACTVGQVVILGTALFGRYFLPSAWLLYLLIAEEAGRLPSRLKTAAAAALAAYALLSIGLAPETTRLKWKNLFAPWPQVLQRSFTTLLEVEQILAPPGTPAVSWWPKAPRPPRVLSIGEWRTYRFPGRLLFNGMYGETPLVWKVTKESRDLTELSKKFWQLGARRVLYNYVTVDWAALRYGSFPWDRRSLRLYVEFCKRHLKILGRTERCDYVNGGFYVYEILRRPLLPPPSAIWFAPGTDSMYGPGIRAENRRHLEVALREYLAAFELLPDVGQAWNRVGHAYTLLNDQPNALRYLRKFGEAGMMDAMNLLDFGAAAVRVRELDLAERVLADAYVRYPHHRHIVLINQGFWNGQKAFQEFVGKRIDAAEKYVELGLQVMANVPEEVDPANEPARRAALAYLLGIKAEVHLVRGERNLAAKWFAQAAQLDSEVPMAPRWRALATQLGTRMFGLSSP